jgi:alanine dehydrogenase
LAEACRRHPALIGGINVMGGHVTFKPVADAHGLAWKDPRELITGLV